MQKHSKLFLLTLALLLAAQAALAEENITELKIEDITAEIEAGTGLEFSFLVGNRIGPPCTAKIQYWVGTENKKVSEGQESIFLGEGETKSETSSLLIPEEVMGISSFFMQMECNDTTVLASKSIRASAPTEIILEFSTLDILNTGPEEPVNFSYTVRSNSDETLPIYIEEHIVKDGNEVWSNTQHSFITGSGSFDRMGPVLPAGTYKFIAQTMYIGKTGNGTARLAEENSFENTNATTPFDNLGQISLGRATIERNFVVESVLNILPVTPMALLGLLAVGAAFTTGCLFQRRRRSPKQKTVPKEPPTSPTPTAVVTVTRKQGKEQPIKPSKNYVCLIESEPSKTLNSKALNSMLDEAGFAEEEKKAVIEISDSIPVEQKVKSSVFIDRFDNPKCETSVEITVSNNSSKDWCNVVLLAKIPGFLSENVSEIAADQNLQVMKEGQIVKFILPKIEAMQSASLVYSIEKWIPQDKVNLVPLPAVINYEEGRPVVVTLKDSKKAAESEKNSDSIHIAEKHGRARKKKSVKKAGKKA